MHLFVYSTQVHVYCVCLTPEQWWIWRPSPSLWEPTCYSIKPYIQVVIYDFAKHVFNLHKVHFRENKSRYYFITMFFSGYKHNVPCITAKYKDKNLDPLNSLPWRGLPPTSGVEGNPSSDLWDMPTVTSAPFLSSYISPQAPDNHLFHGCARNFEKTSPSFWLQWTLTTLHT